MKQDYEKLFSAIEAPEPPAGLTEMVLLRIARRERRILGIKIAVSAVTFAASVGIIIIGYIDLIANLSRSGFFDIASLMFSDFSSMMTNFPDFALSMIESFPVFTAALLLSGVMFAVWSMAALIDEASRARATKFFGAL